MTETPTARASETRVQRLQRLRRAVETSGALHLKDAAELLKVSEMTVRRDLAGPEVALALLGGYVVNAASPTGFKYTFEQEIDQHTQDKRLACRSAAASIKEGDTIFIDCGTTMQSLADCLPEDMPLSVICYSLNVASIVTHRPATQVMLMGGLYHPSSQSFSSDDGLTYLRRLGVNKAFISAGGLHWTRGAAARIFTRSPSSRPSSRPRWRASSWSTPASSAASSRHPSPTSARSHGSSSVARCRQTRASTSAAFRSNT